MPNTYNTIIEKAAKTLADQFYYPWDHMPEKGRDDMRRIARLVIADAVAEERDRCVNMCLKVSTYYEDATSNQYRPMTALGASMCADRILAGMNNA